MKKRLTSKELNAWWYQTEFIEMEKITKYKQCLFDPEDGYQEFVDVCDAWWEQLSLSSKRACYEEYSPEGFGYLSMIARRRGCVTQNRFKQGAAT